jgi:hypothetical protein
VGIDLQARVEHQLCVPAIEMNVESYRRRGALERKNRLLDTPPKRIKETTSS